MPTTNNYRYAQTLCWNCANATDHAACPWVEDFTPVPGWTATKTLLMQDTASPYESYLVTACPLFKRDAYKGGSRKKRGGSNTVREHP